MLLSDDVEIEFVNCVKLCGVVVWFYFGCYVVVDFWVVLVGSVEDWFVVLLCWLLEGLENVGSFLLLVW